MTFLLLQGEMNARSDCVAEDEEIKTGSEPREELHLRESLRIDAVSFVLFLYFVFGEIPCRHLVPSE